MTTVAAGLGHADPTVRTTADAGGELLELVSARIARTGIAEALSYRPIVLGR